MLRALIEIRDRLGRISIWFYFILQLSVAMLIPHADMLDCSYLLLTTYDVAYVTKVSLLSDFKDLYGATLGILILNIACSCFIPCTMFMVLPLFTSLYGVYQMKRALYLLYINTQSLSDARNALYHV